MTWPVIDWSWAIRAFLAHFGLGVILATLVYWVLEMAFISGQYRAGFKKAASVGFIGGVFSVAIDFDHVVLFFGADYARPAHWPLYAISCAITAVSLIFCCIHYVLIGKKDQLEPDAMELRVAACAIAWSLCLIIHVLEDFTFGWF